MKQQKVSRENEITSMIEIMNNVDRYKENSLNGLVILLNGNWGTGKTTFIEELVEKINQQENMELFNLYNAYENDCYENAYIPFFASIAEKIHFQENFTGFIKSIVAGTTTGLSVCAVSVARNFMKNAFKVDINEVAQDLKDSLEEYNDDYLSDYMNFQEHKKYIKQKMLDACSNKTQIFIIDELDRCKPNFAMDTLEIIKHFFDIKNCIFIISVDKEQMEKSLKVIYGTINSEKYFSKLFDYQFNLLPINLREVLDLTDLEKNKIFIDFSSEIFNLLNISIRDGKKILNDLLHKGEKWTICQKSFMLFFFILKYTDLSFYNAFIEGNYLQYKELIEKEYNSELEKYKRIFKYKIRKEYTYNFILELIMHVFYKKYVEIADDNSVKINSSRGIIGTEEIEKTIRIFVPIFNEYATIRENIIDAVR